MTPKADVKLAAFFAFLEIPTFALWRPSTLDKMLLHMIDELKLRNDNATRIAHNLGQRSGFRILVPIYDAGFVVAMSLVALQIFLRRPAKLTGEDVTLKGGFPFDQLGMKGFDVISEGPLSRKFPLTKGAK